MGEKMSNDDLEQMEYLRKWKEQKEAKIQMKKQRNTRRKVHWRMARVHFFAALRYSLPWKGGAE